MPEVNDCQTVWLNCMDFIKDNVQPISFKTWFEPIIPIKLADNILTIQVPSQFFYEYLEEQFVDILRAALHKEIGNNAKLEYNVVMENSSICSEKLTMVIPGQNRANFKNEKFDAQNPHQIKNPFVIPGIKSLQVDPQLNPQYSFDNFVQGKCNRLLRAAGLSLAQSKGRNTYSPLFIYGGSGLGKTHLAQAIGIEAKQRFPNKTVLYVNAAKFQTQFVDARLNNNINDFLHFYQMIDVLILDDVHEFAGKEKTQDAYFHIFDHLHQAGKHLVLTSDQPPANLQGVEHRLLSRFKWGLSADLQVPDYETRVAILRNKIYKDGINVPDDVVDYIATNITQNIRELEGALISLIAQSALNHKEINVALASEMIERLVQTSTKEISIDTIQRSVCEYFGLNLDSLQDKTRKREVVQARQIAMYFAKMLTKSSLSTIGSMIGKKDHATVLHACKTVNNLMDTDKRFRSQVKEIEKMLKSN